MSIPPARTLIRCPTAESAHSLGHPPRDENGRIFPSQHLPPIDPKTMLAVLLACALKVIFSTKTASNTESDVNRGPS